MSNNEELNAKIKAAKDDYQLNLYDKILELRKFEIENFWKRTLFFWGTIAIIYAGYFKAGVDNYQVILPLIGMLFNVIFSLSTRGSKYWQEHWETMAVVYENAMGIELFQTGTDNIIGNRNPSIFTKPYRYSVSKLTMLLSDLSVLLWTLLWLKELINLVRHGILKFEFGWDSEIHLYTVGIIGLHALLIGYFILFFWKGKVFHGFRTND